MSTFSTQLESDSNRFPAPHHALSEPNGLLAMGGDLKPERLLAAYHNGIFPWYPAHHPILWWSPDPRALLAPEQLHISRSMAKWLRHHEYQIWINRQFMQVVQACAAPRRDSDDTWINEELMLSYQLLHARGDAHSIEVWSDNELVGGLYGISVGRLFCGESMFSRQVNTSKLALIALCHHFAHHGGALIDCQMRTDHLASLGVAEWSRQHFIKQLKQLRDESLTPGCWETQQVSL